MVKKIIFMFAICFLLTSSVFANGPAHATIVQVTGVSQKEIAPDIAKIRLSINNINVTVEQARNVNTQFSNQVFAKVKEMGIVDRQIKTEAYRIDPIYSYENSQLPKLTGYKAVNSIEITAPIEMTGILINELTNAGANEIDSIRFEKANESAVKNEALREAVKNALEKAWVIANALGKNVSAVKEVNESGTSYQPVILANRALKAGLDAAAPPIAAGKITVGATVQVIVELE